MPSIEGHEIVQEARSWLETPYRHQGRLKHIAVDCVGLIVGVGQALGGLSINPEDWSEFSRYARTPNPTKMLEGMERFLVPLDLHAVEPAPDGCIAWLEWREDLPMHLGLMATFEGRRTLIHAYQGAGKCVEHGFEAPWPDRVSSWWRYPGGPAVG
jgi:NlpC/P60 family putative phage cell wall peptidase